VAESMVVLAPISGAVVQLSDVPDPVFAGQMVGSGAAVEPPAGEAFDVVSPWREKWSSSCRTPLWWSANRAAAC
jgi:phosphotransferase system IIA component